MNVEWNNVAKDGNSDSSFEHGNVFLVSMRVYKEPLHHLNDCPFLHKDSSGGLDFGQNLVYV
jgi:hypothetical protein